VKHGVFLCPEPWKTLKKITIPDGCSGACVRRLFSMEKTFQAEYLSASEKQ
jgi:hypothetical protein